MTPGVPRMPAPTIESLRAVRPHAQRQVEVGEFAPHRLDVLASQTKKMPALLTLIMSTETPRSASRSEELAVERARATTSSMLALDHAEERHILAAK